MEHTERQVGRCRSRRAFTLVEVIISILIFLVAMLPITDLLVSSQRNATMARKLVDATIFGQTLLELVAAVPADELPSIGASPTPLLGSSGAASGPAGASTWTDVTIFASTAPQWLSSWSLTAERLPGGEVRLQVEFSWLAVPGSAASKITRTLETFARPGTWQ